MVEKFKKSIGLLALLSTVILFYFPFLISSKVPIPLDTVVGLYSPYRDFYAANYPNGIPFKNFLITDPVRQTYIWKELSIDMFSKLQLPLWNPYEMTGKPLLANFQSGVFYPLNLVFLITPFYVSWSLFIMLQTLLLSIFTYLYLRNLKLNSYASILGSISVVFSGFSISWLEWGNVIHTILWLPLILFSIDRISQSFNEKKSFVKWFCLLSFAIVSSFFAGHLQTFMYLYIVSISYFVLRWFEVKRNKKILIGFIISNLLVIIVTIVQWYPTAQFIFLSARNTDQNYLTTEGWFVPFRHLIQFVAPDFFGNPATLNYWGTWNYGELVGYIGIIPLTLSLFSIFKKSRTVIFFLAVVFVSLLFCLPTGISNLPFILHIPLISSAQPTRLLFLTTFSLSVLASFGTQFLYEHKKSSLKYIRPVIFAGLVFVLLWILVITKSDFIFGKPENVLIAKRNLVFPTIIFLIGSVLISLSAYSKSRKVKSIYFTLLLLISLFELIRFAQKFTPFVSTEYLYPSTKVLDFLKSQPGIFRISSTDRRIMPPNFFTHYRLQTIEGYDPLYLQAYAEYITAMERRKADISEPFGFNRIITPQEIYSTQFDFLNVRYILSFDEINTSKFTKIYQEGQTKIYKNNYAFDRIFFVHAVHSSTNDIYDMFQTDIKTVAIVTDLNADKTNLSIGNISNISYTENKIDFTVSNNGDGFIVMSDAYYPTWSAYVDGVKTHLYKTDHAFRGIFVSKGTHTVQFKDSLF